MGTFFWGKNAGRVRDGTNVKSEGTGEGRTCLMDLGLLKVPIQLLNFREKVSWETKPWRFFLAATASALLRISLMMWRASLDTSWSLEAAFSKSFWHVMHLSGNQRWTSWSTHGE